MLIHLVPLRTQLSPCFSCLQPITFLVDPPFPETTLFFLKYLLNTNILLFCRAECQLQAQIRLPSQSSQGCLHSILPNRISGHPLQRPSLYLFAFIQSLKTSLRGCSVLSPTCSHAHLLFGCHHSDWVWVSGVCTWLHGPMCGAEVDTVG